MSIIQVIFVTTMTETRDQRPCFVTDKRGSCVEEMKDSLKHNHILSCLERCSSFFFVDFPPVRQGTLLLDYIWMFP